MGGFIKLSTRVGFDILAWCEAGKTNGKNHCLGSQYAVGALWAAETTLVWIKRKSVTSHVSNHGGGIESAALAKHKYDFSPSGHRPTGGEKGRDAGSLYG